MGIIQTDGAPSHTGPVPQAVEAGGWIHVSALFGADPLHRAIPEDARAEAEQIFANLEATLAAADAALTDVVRVGIVMRDLQRDQPVSTSLGRAVRRSPAGPFGHPGARLRPQRRERQVHDRSSRVPRLTVRAEQAASARTRHFTQRRASGWQRPLS